MVENLNEPTETRNTEHKRAPAAEERRVLGVDSADLQGPV